MADITRFNGGTTLTGLGITLFQVLSLRGRLKIELIGVRFRGPRNAALDMARSIAGVNFPKGDKGRKAAIEWLDGYITLVRGACTEAGDDPTNPQIVDMTGNAE